MFNNTLHYIDISQIRVGLYVHLDLGWMDHPFMLSNFKVKDETQIQAIRKTGLKKLRYDPKRSDCNPLPEEQATPTPVVTAEPAEQESKEIANKNENISLVPRLERVKQLSHAINESEKQFVAACGIVRKATQTLHISPQASIEQTTQIVHDLVDTALMEDDVAIHALNGNNSQDSDYFHPMNVTVLSLLLAKSVEMSKEDAHLLALAAMFHDIGKSEIPEKIVTKKEALTTLEQAQFEKHSEIGARMAREAGLDVRISQIILQHHVYADGSGYPKQIGFSQVDQLARVIALVNWYDNLCNPNNLANAKTPHEALAYMYAHQRSKFDESLLKHMIKLLGIYPPGSIVQLSSGVYAIVISVNPSKPLRPFVMVHDPLVNRHAPQIIDLREEPSLSISACLRPNQLPLDILNHLNPRKRISYFIDSDLASTENKQFQ